LAVWGSNGSDPGQFKVPTSIAIDSQGNFFVSEVDNSRVQIFSPEGDYIAELAPGILSSPHGLSFDSQGNLYVADTGNNSVNKFTLAN
jgi:sugar lactone lactonase YvrE|tara:strand:+ start:61 stop:324 length:264 start_codon:yes stop_codon:yes gene_type:complete